MNKGIRNKDKYKLLVSDISYSKLIENRHPSIAGPSTCKAGPCKAGPSKADTEQLQIKSLNMSVDKECYSCLCDVHEKSKYIICMCCKKILHEKCYDDWIKKTPNMKSTCSYCQQEGVLVKYTNPSKKTKKLKRCFGCTEFIQL
tara:strand:+ start:459 stop:890 length:432 start_codon:yes stop_codon:yes gene_type:complete